MTGARTLTSEESSLHRRKQDHFEELDFSGFITMFAQRQSCKTCDKCIKFQPCIPVHAWILSPHFYEKETSSTWTRNRKCPALCNNWHWLYEGNRVGLGRYGGEFGEEVTGGVIESQYRWSLNMSWLPRLTGASVNEQFQRLIISTRISHHRLLESDVE